MEVDEMSKLKYERKNIKKWAQEHYKGLENALLPTFTKDMSDIDEQAIRLDVRQSIKHGFCKTLVCTDGGTTLSELKRMLEVVVDEACGKIIVSMYLGFDNLKTQLEMLKFGEKIGIDTVLMYYATGETFDSEDDIFDYTKRIFESTDLAIDLYASHKFNFERFHPSTFSADLVCRMAEFENAAGFKDGCPDLSHLVETFAYCGDNILPSMPIECFFPIFTNKYGMKWAGAAHYEFFQDTENRQLVTYFQLLKEGRLKEAMEIYWRLTPIRIFWNESTLAQIKVGTYHYDMWKYAQWLVGGSGGRVRLPHMHLYEHDKIAIKNLMRASGIKVRDEEYPY
jgi:4-hydroxy-tetrahydrodipicolinate synthase